MVLQAQWRIQNFPEGPQNGSPTYYLAIFCRQLRENKMIWPGGAHPWRPLGSTTEVVVQRGIIEGNNHSY